MVSLHFDHKQSDSLPISTLPFPYIDSLSRTLKKLIRVPHLFLLFTTQGMFLLSSSIFVTKLEKTCDVVVAVCEGDGFECILV